MHPSHDDEQIKGDYEEQTGALIVATFKAISLRKWKWSSLHATGRLHGENRPKKPCITCPFGRTAEIAIGHCNDQSGNIAVKQAIINKHYQRKHGNNAYYGQK